MPIEQLNGIELYYEEHGEGAPVVFLHGAGGNHISWWQQIPAFRERYRCITIDHRGFGRSTDPQNEGWGRHADDLEALLDHLGTERAALVAQSMGGITALGFAVRHPERVTALAMCDTWGFFNWPEYFDVRNTTTLGDRFQREDPVGTFLYQQLAGLTERSMTMPKYFQEAVSTAPTRDRVAALGVPSLFVAGTEDALLPALRATADLVPGSEYVEFPGCGHSVYFENPDAFNDCLAAFLAKHVPKERLD